MLPDKVGTTEYKVPTFVRRIMVPYGHFDPYKGLYSLDTFCDAQQELGPALFDDLGGSLDDGPHQGRVYRVRPACDTRAAHA